ncbi:MAG: hypothetical protein U0M66_06340 [Bacilli bacterium]|nr:hypothetical protein [Bacilli bacterium]
MNKIDEINKHILELKNAGEQVKKISDGYHIFDELYEQRMVLLCYL